MNPALRQSLEARLAAGQDSALARFSLGSLCLKAGETGLAVEHLARAVAQQPDYSAAWSLLGQAYRGVGVVEKAADAFRSGIAVAERGGDVQAARQMRVLLRKLDPNCG